MNESHYPVDREDAARFRRDWHAIVRGLASREDLGVIRPVVERVVRRVASKEDRQDRAASELNPVLYGA